MALYKLFLIILPNWTVSNYVYFLYCKQGEIKVKDLNSSMNERIDWQLSFSTETLSLSYKKVTKKTTESNHDNQIVMSENPEQRF